MVASICQGHHDAARRATYKPLAIHHIQQRFLIILFSAGQAPVRSASTSSAGLRAARGTRSHSGGIVFIPGRSLDSRGRDEGRAAGIVAVQSRLCRHGVLGRQLAEQVDQRRTLGAADRGLVQGPAAAWGEVHLRAEAGADALSQAVGTVMAAARDGKVASGGTDDARIGAAFVLVILRLGGGPHQEPSFVCGQEDTASQVLDLRAVEPLLGDFVVCHDARDHVCLFVIRQHGYRQGYCVCEPRLRYGCSVSGRHDVHAYYEMEQYGVKLLYGPRPHWG